MKDMLSNEAGAASGPFASSASSLNADPVSRVGSPLPAGAPAETPPETPPETPAETPAETLVSGESAGSGDDRSDAAGPPVLAAPQRASSPVMFAALEASHFLRNALRVTAATLCVISVYLFLLHPTFGGYVAIGLPLCVMVMAALRLIGIFACFFGRSGIYRHLLLGRRVSQLVVEFINLALITLGAFGLAGALFCASIMEIPSLGVVAAVALLTLVLIDPTTTRSAKRRELDQRRRTRLQRQTLEALQIAQSETEAVAGMSTGPVRGSGAGTSQ